LKLFAFGRVLARGCIFTLNLGPEVEAKAREKGSHWMRRQIERRVSVALGPRGIALVLEATREAPHRLHAHGFIDATSNSFEALRGALKLAGGRWANTKGSGYQVDIEEVKDPDLWSSYCMKHQGRTRRVYGLKGTVSVSQSVTREAKILWEELREKYSKKKSTKEDVIITKFSGIEESDLDKAPSEIHKKPKMKKVSQFLLI